MLMTYLPPKKELIGMYNSAAIRAVMGRVRTQAVKISPATPQRTFDNLSAEPTPIMAELTTWVVETGPPRRAAPKITVAEVTWDVKPWMGRMRYIFAPKVLIIRHPPVAVPKDMDAALSAITHQGTTKPRNQPVATRLMLIIPIVF
jgi:hypothetical protein